MRTFFATIRSDQRLRLRCPHLIAARARGAILRIRSGRLCGRLCTRLTPAAQDGFLLVEVIVSAMLVALIVVATFNGFDVVNRAQAANRAHDQAVILAAESQEQLRTDPVSTLQALETTPHTYTQTVNGTSYEITQQATPSNGSANTTGCSAIETTKQTGANVEITSKVTWAGLALAKRPEIKLSSIITPPTGAGLEVDVGNNPTPTEGVPGVTAVVTFRPVNSITTETREGTTNAAGCVVFGDIESSSATVEIKEKSGFVTTSGTLKVPSKEILLAPNITVHDEVVYDQGGAIKANFTWEGKSVTGDNFVVFNNSLPATPKYEVGANLFSYESAGEEHYSAETGKYGSSATTAKGTRYSTGDLFPFLLPNEWLAYSGDCIANNPHTIDSAVADGEVLVKPGATSEVNVPISRTALLAREGTRKNPSTGVAGLRVKITNTACSGYTTPNNASKLNITREQNTTSEGTLENPYQAFGAYEVCVANKTTKKRYKYSGSNLTPAGTSPAIYLAARSSTERATLKAAKEKEEEAAEAKRIKEEKEAKEKRESKEATAKAERETEEKPAKTKWETEAANEAAKKTSEATTKATRETTEANEKAQWQKELECYNQAPVGTTGKSLNTSYCKKSGGKYISPAEKTTKEATQTTNRATLIAAEKALETARIAEEATTKANKTAQETTQHTKETEETTTRTTKETEETTARTKKEGEESAVETKRKTEETEETEEATTTKVTVESGFETC
jgi:type II secretory pathway pseudopilin PulG